MRVAIATLADAANVREGLLSILSGLITQLNRDSYPSPMLAQVVLALEFSEDEARTGDDFAILVKIEDLSNDGASIAEIEGRVGVNPGSESRGNAYLPLVLDTSNVQVPAPGPYQVRVRADKAAEVVFGFHALLIESK